MTCLILKEKGVKGLYAGSIPNYTRCLLKNTYKYPLMVGLPAFYKQKMPSKMTENASLAKFLTGFSIALIESLILCPIERVKVHFMTKTSTNVISYSQFFAKIKPNL